jgi:ABC-type transport system involved in multi-copper enzyme maturation permease subunit
MSDIDLDKIIWSRITFKVLLLIVIITKSLDYLTTGIALTNPYNYESVPFGNVIYINFPLVLIVLGGLYYAENRIIKTNHWSSLIYSFLPLIAVINNLIIIFR